MIFIIIPIFCILAIFYPTRKISNSLSILFSLAGLIQLEVTGLFEYVDYFSKELEKIYDESGLTPSNITRAIHEYYNPEPTLKAFIDNQLYFNKRFGFYLLLIGGVIQLFITWLA